MKIIRVADPYQDVPIFTENIPKHRGVVMVYMMQDCPYCEHLKPKWEMLKKIMHSDNKFDDVMMADIDSNVVNELPLPPVMSFPKIRVLSGDKVTDYDGVREVDPLLSFIRKTVTTPRKRTARRRTTSRRHSTKRHNSTARRRSTARRHSSKRSKSRSTHRRHTTKRRSKSL